MEDKITVRIKVLSDLIVTFSDLKDSYPEVEGIDEVQGLAMNKLKDLVNLSASLSR